MKTWIKVVGVFLASACMSTAAQQADHPPHWDYAGEVGPEHWAEFGMGFAACSGRNQSPVNLANFIEAELPPIAFDYKVGGNEVVNNGHSIQINYSPGSRLTVDDIAFELKQVHFHSPSEHHLNGKSFPIEAHFVHADADGNLAVVALLVEQGDGNEALSRVWTSMPGEEGDKQPIAPAFAATDLLPGNRDYYRYEGSLTTPPCSEGVRWLLMKQPVTASAEQIAKLAGTLGRANNRPVQPIGARVILQ